MDPKELASSSSRNDRPAGGSDMPEENQQASYTETASEFLTDNKIILLIRICTAITKTCCMGNEVI